MSPLSPKAHHCVIIPSYNSGILLKQTVCAVLENVAAVIVVIDGSTDGSEEAVISMADSIPELQVVRLPQNGGKGTAVLRGLEFALQQEFSHAVVFDSDGQHEAADLNRFIEVSLQHPEAMILGVPIFGPEAPELRIKGRLVGNWWTHLETLWGGVNDSLFGFRIYPILPSLKILQGIRGGRRFDFDTQLAVRLYWEGVPPINIPTPVHYKKRNAGGVSHFHYLRDNLLLVMVHTQLTLIACTLIPRLIELRRRTPLTFL